MADIKETEVEKPQAQENQPGISPSLTEEEKELAANAYEEFEKRNFDACIACLKKLLRTRPKDPKILHNYAVAEYYASDFVKTKHYRQKVAELCQQSNINIENVDSLEDVDHCVIYFNQAVILFHLHQYYASIAILDKLFQFIEPLDEHLTRKVCFLLLELYLSTHQPEKALGLIGYIENMLFGSGSSGIGNGGKGHKAPTPDKDGKEREGSREKDNHNKELSELNRNELYRPKLQHYKARCYIMLKSTKACKREIKNLMSSGVSIPAIFLRSQLEYLRGNYRKAIKVLNTAFSGSSSGGGRSYKDSGDNLEAMFYNNLGCIHFYMGKPNLGAYYFTKALQEHQKGTTSVSLQNTDPGQPLTSRPLHTLDITACYQMLYNLGLQFLHSGKPQQAFDNLIQAVQVYPNNPRLWLRIAECCILAHKADNSVDFRPERKNDLLRGMIGSGAHRKLLLKPSLPDKNKHNMASSAMPILSLEFASLCLSNALLLLPEEGSTGNFTEAKEEQKQQQPAANSTTPTNQDVCSAESIVVLPVPPSNSLQKCEMGCLRNSVLAAHSYVSLCLGDVLMSLKFAETLLAQPKIFGVQRFLGHLYAAESLLLLDRIGEAIQHLNPELISDISLHPPPGDDGKVADDRPRTLNSPPAWYPSSVSTAKGVLQYNLAVAYTLRGELEKASETLKQLQNTSTKASNTEFPMQVIMLAIYIQLQQGHVDLAKKNIKQHLPQYR